VKILVLSAQKQSVGMLMCYNLATVSNMVAYVAWFSLQFSWIHH